MYPNQSPQQPPVQPTPQQPYPAPQPELQTDAAYLDSIATPLPQKTISPLLLWGAIGGALLLLALIVILISTSGGPSKAEQFANYLYRVQAVSKLTKASAKTIKSSELQALNASTTSILTSAEQEGTALLDAFDMKKLPTIPKSSPITTEFTTLDTTLNDARLNVAFDRTYSREIGYQLAKIRAEMSRLYESSKSNSVKTYLENTDKNLKPLVTQFTAFNNSQS